MHGTYLKKTLHSYLSFQLALLYSVSYSFFTYRSPSLSLCTVCDAISANILVFGDFDVHHKDWLTYSGGTVRPGELVIIFLSRITLLNSLTFLLGSLTVTLTVLLFWIFFFLLTLVFVL